MLTVTNLKKKFGGLAAADGVTFEVPAGTITALIGPNGAGKTTVFNIISGTVSADAGTIKLDGKDFTRLSVEERARLGLSRTFQLPRPFKNLTVREHLRLAGERDDDLFWRSLWRREPEKKIKKELARILKSVCAGIPLDRRAAEVSYGQSKLLGLAMALTHPHRILLLDEPVAGVNPVVRETVSNVLATAREAGETVFLIEHDMAFVMPLADRVIVMDRGRIIAHGTPAEVQRDPDVLQAYLGQQL